jgi:hypothetical protein
MYVCESDTWIAVDPLTTKGDIMVYSTAPIRLAVGSNELVLEADSSEAAGIKWGNKYGYSSSASLDPGSCAANTTCTYSWYDDDVGAGWMCLCWVASVLDDDLISLGGGCRTITDYVQKRFYNVSGDPIDPGSTTMFYMCWG